MQSLGKSQIIKIGESILKEGSIVAKHGTSIKNGFSIMETGFNFHRTSMVIQKSNNVISLCTYGWKENAKGDASNVIISIPNSFFKDLLGFDEEDYSKWISNIKESDSEISVINSLCDMETDPLGFMANLPKEFIRGIFIYTDNKNYLSFINNFEDALNYLTYVDNPCFYENLTEEEKQNFVNKIRNKILKKNNVKENKS